MRKYLSVVMSLCVECTGAKGRTPVVRLSRSCVLQMSRLGWEAWPKPCVLVLYRVAGSTMLLRETSLMPHIPGLPALLSMLFAPVMELR